MHRKSHQQSQWSAGTINSKKTRAFSGVPGRLSCPTLWPWSLNMSKLLFAPKQKRHCCILNRISNNSRAWFRISYWQFSIEFLNSQFSVQLQMTEAEYYVSIADFLSYPRLYDRDSQHIWLGKTSESIRSLDDKCWWWTPLLCLRLGEDMLRPWLGCDMTNADTGDGPFVLPC